MFGVRLRRDDWQARLKTVTEDLDAARFAPPSISRDRDVLALERYVQWIGRKSRCAE